MEMTVLNWSQKENRVALKLSFVLVLCFTLWACQPIKQNNQNEPSVAGGQPNIIVIMTDDQAPFTLEHMPVVQSELAQHGVQFALAIATTPLCCPSRASILTGQYAHNHGVLTNRLPNGSASVFDDSSTIATWLHEAGYQTAYLGKYLNGYGDLVPQGYVPPGWDEWKVFVKRRSQKGYYYKYKMSFNGKIVRRLNGSKDFSNDLLSRKAVQFISQNSESPFFMVVAYFAPHPPIMAADRHQSYFRTDDQYTVRRPPNFNEVDISDKPEWVQSLELMEEPYRADLLTQNSLRSLLSVDEGLADILKELKSQRIDDNTVIIFLSDNGVTAGEHRIVRGKNCPYEECLLIPLVIRDPRKEVVPYINEQIVLNIDIAPTIAEIAGLEIPSSIDGKSLVPLLSQHTNDWREEALIEHWGGDDWGDEGEMVALIPAYQGLRTLDWKFVRYETGEIELYNLVEDPYELDNLAISSKYDDVIEDLSQRVDQLFNE